LPKLVEIEGIDEAGRVGDRIFVVRLGVPLPSESTILLQNLEHFDNLLVRHSDLQGRDATNLLKYARDLLDNPHISSTIFVLRESTQLRLLRELMRLQAENQFVHRKTLIQIIKREDYRPEDLSSVITDLSVLEKEPVYVESFVKAFAIRKITMKLETLSPLLRDPRQIDRLIVVQVDGGFPFVFWWKDLIDSGVLSKMKRGTVFFAGITNADGHYPLVSAAGAVASILHKYPQYSHLYPTRELEIENDSELPDQSFYRGHITSLTRPTFQFRMLLIGDIGDTLRSLLPYAFHKAQRTKTWEAFKIEKSVEDFLATYGAGGPENTIGVYGALNTPADKDGVKLLRDEGYPCYHTSDLRSSVEGLFDDLAGEIELLPSERRSTIQLKLTALREKCKKELK
jgi:hypothetical protein